MYHQSGFNAVSAKIGQPVEVYLVGDRQAAAELSRVPGDGQQVPSTTVELVVEDIIARRRDRLAFFPERLFADPAWEILLALTLAESRQCRLTVSNLCDCVAAPATTALRWISLMTDQGFLVRRDDPTDRRRKFIELSADSRAKMNGYCSMAATTHAGHVTVSSEIRA